MKLKIEATIPTTQYGNLRPTFEIEQEGDEELALQQLTRLWSRFGETPLKDKSGGGVVKKTFTGEEILWNVDTHTYTDMSGNVLMSGSQYANAKSPKFDLEMMLPKTASSWGVDAEDLREVWKLNGDISNQFGSAIHSALELYHRHHTLGSVVSEKQGNDVNYVLPKNKFIRDAVLSFVDQFGADGLSEVLVSDIGNKMAGTIDRLQITGEKRCRVGDYKTNNDLDKKKMAKYQLQLSFYAQILKNHGWTVEGLDLFHFGDDGWTKHELEILEIDV